MSECFSLAFGIGTQNSAGDWLEVFYPQPLLNPSNALIDVIKAELGYAEGNQAISFAASQCGALSQALNAAGFSEQAALVAQMTDSARPLVATVLASDEAPSSTPNELHVS